MKKVPKTHVRLTKHFTACGRNVDGGHLIQVLVSGTWPTLIPKNLVVRPAQADLATCRTCRKIHGVDKPQSKKTVVRPTIWDRLIE